MRLFCTSIIRSFISLDTQIRCLISSVHASMFYNRRLMITRESFRSNAFWYCKLISHYHTVPYGTVRSSTVPYRAQTDFNGTSRMVRPESTVWIASFWCIMIWFDSFSCINGASTSITTTPHQWCIDYPARESMMHRLSSPISMMHRISSIRVNNTSIM